LCLAIGTLQFQARLSQALLAPTRPEASPAALDLIPVRRNLAVTPSMPSSLKKTLRAPSVAFAQIARLCRFGFCGPRPTS